MTLWRLRRTDLVPMLFILLLPAVIAAPQLLGWLRADPALYVAGMTVQVDPGLLPGRPYIDPNNGFTTQALGYRAALDWLRGVVPWWNPYTGVGLPLAAEYQPAALFPFTLLLLLPAGTAWLQLAMQWLCGVGTYGLLRQMGTGRLASATGALLFAFNGTLAWFSHGPASALPFLPWMLWAIERAYAAAALRVAGGWRILAFAMALSLLAGFPETAYINGLLALAWATLRGVQTKNDRRLGYAMRIAAGGIAGVAIAAPQVLAFFQYLTQSFTGNHADFSHAAQVPPAALSSFVAPYVFGPIFAFADRWHFLPHVWGGIGGYVTLALLAAAAYGALARRNALSALLVVWCLLAILKSFAVEPAVSLLNLVPGVAISAFARYAQPSWELAFILLAAWGLDAFVKGEVSPRVSVAAGILLAAGLAISLACVWRIWPHLSPSVHLRNWAAGAMAWAMITACACWWLLRPRASVRRAAWALSLMLVLDSALMFAIPTLSNPRGGAVDMAAIGFLRENLGLQRFYTLGPIQPNYGAYFGIASINHNYLPVSNRWVDWIRGHLDSAADGVVFNGNYPRPAGSPSQAQELRRNLPGYEAAAVKYVVVAPHENPFEGLESVKQVYADATLRIFELPAPKPYFEASGGPCTLRPSERESVLAQCEAPARLVRRELFFPGWTATVNGRAAGITEHDALFQSIDLPAGRAEVRYRYAPPFADWAWWAAFIAGGSMLVPWARLLSRRTPGTPA